MKTKVRTTKGVKAVKAAMRRNHVFDLAIVSKDGKVVLKWNGEVNKWEAWIDDKLAHRRRNIGVLVSVVNGDHEAIGSSKMLREE